MVAPLTVGDLRRRLSVLANALMEAGSGLPAAVVVRDILRITSPLQRARLFAELRRRPTLFRDEQQPGTAAAQRFTLALIARGHGLRPPRCSRCGREGLAKHHDGAGGKLCNPCVSLVRAPVCVMCGRRDHRYRTRDGAHYCASCWWTTPAGVSERAALNALEARALQTRRVVFITRTVAARCDAPLTSIVRAVLTPVTSGRVLGSTCVTGANSFTATCAPVSLSYALKSRA